MTRSEEGVFCRETFSPSSEGKHLWSPGHLVSPKYTCQSKRRKIIRRSSGIIGKILSEEFNAREGIQPSGVKVLNLNLKFLLSPAQESGRNCITEEDNRKNPSLNCTFQTCLAMNSSLLLSNVPQTSEEILVFS